MKGFELFDHTADVGIRATGRDLAEAFGNVARGMFSVIAELDAIAPRETHQVSITAPDQEALVVDWLNELLYLFEVEGLLFSQFAVELLGDRELRATCSGEPVAPGRHHIKTGVKAATYHGLQVGRNDGWHIQVILDI
ncbi:MAG: archease [Chloroflexi bacterium]|nr:archease [Chloroflexota bacterium]